MAICVLTGDLIRSLEMTDAQLLRAKSVLVKIDRRLHENSSNSSIDIYRGDGWQTSFGTPQRALRIALCFVAALRAESDSFATRISISVGEETYSKQTIEAATSPSFIASGRALDRMPSIQNLTHASGGALQAATILADYVSSAWTSAQANAVLPFLTQDQKPTQGTVADSLGISRQAVGQALVAAGFPAIDRALRAIEEQAK